MALVVKENTLKSASARTNEERSGSRFFFVSDDAGANITTIAAETATGIPAIGDGFPDASTRKCISVKASYLDGRRDICEVEVEYATSKNDITDNPLDDDDVWSIDTEEWEEEYYIDTADQKCVLTNGKPITPRPKRKAIGYKLVIRRNVSNTYSLTNFATYNNKVNSDSISYAGVTVATAGQAHCIMGLSETQERNGVKFRVLTISLTIIENGHQQKFDSRDKEELVDGELRPITDPLFGQEVDFAYPLNENGTAAASHTSDPFEIERKPYAEVAMASFIAGA